MNVLDRIRRRLPKPDPDHPTKCRFCKQAATFQLTPLDTMDDRYEMLCRDHLCVFLGTFADVTVKEWMVVRL